MTNYECGRALVYIAEVIIKTFGKEFGYEVQEPKQEPKEPLIKDEKIRKAVRAWAEAVGTECVEITHSRSHFIRFMSYLADEDELCMSREIGQIFDEKLYTIAELCGEEEE